MKLATIKKGLSGTGVPAIVEDGRVLDLESAADLYEEKKGGPLPKSVAGILAGGEAVHERLFLLLEKAQAEGDAAPWTPVDKTGFLAPVPEPRLILCTGMAYRAHLEEMNAPLPEHPVGFIKSSATVIGSSSPIVLPSQCPDMVDFEGEFAIVIGRTCHNVSEERAMDHVAGYTLVNDVSARDWVEIWRQTGDMFFNYMGKQLPGFCPMGPVIATADDIPDPHKVHFTTTVSGKIMQKADTSDLIFSVAETIAFFSRWYCFSPGDVITTGSPAGVGYGRSPQRFLHDGDEVVVEMAEIGALRNLVERPARV